MRSFSKMPPAVNRAESSGTPSSAFIGNMIIRPSCIRGAEAILQSFHMPQIIFKRFSKALKKLMALAVLANESNSLLDCDGRCDGMEHLSQGAAKHWEAKIKAEAYHCAPCHF